ncbi:hypothetical protein NZK32_01475 [Cyanobium sp. FGCU-52]|nr:hypothetical protein [Cyanobium sp. FGCU52]
MSAPRGRGRLVVGKDARVAVLCSLLIPGGGQFYNGDTLKGLVMLVASLALLVTVIGPLLIGAWSLVDAAQVARGRRPTW